MNQRTLLVIAVLALAALAATLLIQPRDYYRPRQDSEAFLSGLLAEANNLNSLSLYLGGGELIGQFSRVEGRWISSSPAGYPADWGNIRSLIGALAAAKISELKTANPDYYERLGVRDASDPEATGVRIELATETTRWSVILGKKAASRQGQYARIPDQSTSVLLDTEIELSRDPIGWLEQEIVNLPVAEVRGVTIQHPDGAEISLRKFATDAADFILLGVPENRQARTGFTINAIGGGLAGLEMQKARGLETVDFSGAISARFECFDGRVVNASLVQLEDESWIRISAEYTPAEGAGDNEKEASAWVDKLNDGKSVWAFAIPEYKYKTLTRQLEDLLEPVGE